MIMGLGWHSYGDLSSEDGPRKFAKFEVSELDVRAQGGYHAGVVSRLEGRDVNSTQGWDLPNGDWIYQCKPYSDAVSIVKVNDLL